MRRAAAALAALLLSSGCDLVKSLENREVLIATVLATPEVTANPAAGLPAMPAQVTALVFFGERQDGTSFAPPVGVADATVTLTYRENGADRAVKLFPLGSTGQYRAGGFPYLPGVEYRFSVARGGREYTGSAVAPAPPHATMTPAGPTFSPYAQLQAVKLDFARSGDDLAFYGVWSGNGSLRETCTNSPLDPSRLVEFMLDTSAWEVSSYALPVSTPTESCFPHGQVAGAPAGYLVGLAIASRGTFSDDLFSGSLVLAGAFDVKPLVFTP